MRILAADSFKGKRTSLNAIPINVVKNGDICIVRIQNGDETYHPGIYYMEFVDDTGASENVPYVVNPISNLTNDRGSRWILKDMFLKRLLADEVITGTISHEYPITPTSTTMTLSTSGASINNGQLIVNSLDSEPPFVVNSDELVTNLNAQYINGQSVDDLMSKIEPHTMPITEGVRSMNVYSTLLNGTSINYTVFYVIENTVDSVPSIYSHMITSKELDHFTITFSGIIDSANYIIKHYIIYTD